MAAGNSAAGAPRRRGPIQILLGWKLWGLPGPALLLILGAELITAAGFAASLPGSEWQRGDVIRWVLLAALSAIYAELTARVARMRWTLTPRSHVEMNSAWAFAAVLALPTPYAGALVAFLFAFSAWQRSHIQPLVPHREIFTTSTAVLAAVAAGSARLAIEHHLPGPTALASSVAILAALAIYFCTNTCLVLVTIYLAVGPVPVRDLLPDREEFGLEVGTLIVGFLTAETLHQQPWLTPMVLVLLVLLQRSSLVTQLELAAATDAKTGLLNASAWQELAQRELMRAQHEDAPCAVLLLDLDHFKNVNDTLGHLAGDVALRAIGDALKRELRGHDAVARFGGEEFVVFLNGLRVDEAVAVAERTLTRIRSLVVAAPAGGTKIMLTASIGLATYPEHGQDLTDLLEAADSALYGAKRAGRDRVGLPPDQAVAVAHPA